MFSYGEPPYGDITGADVSIGREGERGDGGREGAHYGRCSKCWY